MSRTLAGIAMLVVLACPVSPSLAQSQPPATAPAAAAATPATAPAKPSRFTMTKEKLKELKARWSQNRPKLAACKKEVKSKGLTGDDRWFFMSDCMDKT